MSVRLFLGNLPSSATEADVRAHVAAVAPPLSVVLPMDRETGRPRGFAFVDYADLTTACEVIRRLNGQPFLGRTLSVSEARPREEGPGPRSNGFAGPGRSAPPGSMGRAPRPDQPTRNFGPDAPPRGKRKPKGHSSKGERGPKGPIRERGGGQFFAGGVDDSQDDQAPDDDVAFWLRATPENPDEE